MLYLIKSVCPNVSHEVLMPLELQKFGFLQPIGGYGQADAWAVSCQLCTECILIYSAIVYSTVLIESEIHIVVSDSLRPHGLYSPWNSAGQNTGVGSLSLLQGIYSTQE